MEIKKLACELESWAQEKGWKTVTQLITPHHFGDLLLTLNDVMGRLCRTGCQGHKTAGYGSPGRF